MTMQVAVIIPAAGSGTRFNDAAVTLGGKSKIEQDLAGKPVFLRAIEIFLHNPRVAQIILAVNPGEISDFQVRWGDKLAFHNVKIVPGGKKERWETVLRALETVADDCTHVAVHDAARPLASAALVNRVFDAAARVDAAIPAVPVTATLKKVTSDDEATGTQPADPLDAILGNAGKPDMSPARVLETIDRRDFVEVQTPQVFAVDLLRRAYANLANAAETTLITDDAMLVEQLGETVWVVDGESTNVKITRPDDMKTAEALATVAEREKSAGLGAKRLFADNDD